MYACNLSARAPFRREGLICTVQGNAYATDCCVTFHFPFSFLTQARVRMNTIALIPGSPDSGEEMRSSNRCAEISL